MVSSCICLRKSFAEIKKLAERMEYSSVSELQANGICSTNCKLCLPYVAEMLKTGETEFTAGTVYTSAENK